MRFEPGKAVSGHILPWSNVVRPPFEGGIYRVAPLQRSTSHNHYEAETFLILEGAGQITVNSECSDIRAGDVVFLPPFSQHSIFNASDKVPLSYLAVWWEDRRSFPLPEERRPLHELPAQLVVVASRITPNGDVHLGHLAGPYLAADVLSRYAGLRGVEVRLISGTDDHQSYVRLAARRHGMSDQAMAAEKTARIEEVFDKVGFRPDVFWRSSASPQHMGFAQDFFLTLYRRGALRLRGTDMPYCNSCRMWLPEGLVRGGCPNCLAESYGDACERCSHPNFGIDLTEPSCSLCAAPAEMRPTRRFFFAAEVYRPQLAAFHASASMPQWLRVAFDEYLSGPLQDIPVTNPFDLGIPVPLPNFEDQRISAWFETAVGLLTGPALATDGHDDSWPGARFWKSDQCEIAQFFGFDNAYFYGVLYPALLLAFDDQIRLPRYLLGNKLYQLCGQKFSTSGQVAIWGDDLLRKLPPDAIRFYLALTRPEAESTSFAEEECVAIVRTELLGALGAWLQSLQQRVSGSWQDRAPFPGSWNAYHRIFFRRLHTLVRLVEESYSPGRFSLRRAADHILEIVHSAKSFAESSRGDPLRSLAGADQATDVALELVAAKALAAVLHPLMPQAAAELWSGLGFQDKPEWPDPCSFVPGGQPIRGLGGGFFEVLAQATAARDVP